MSKTASFDWRRTFTGECTYCSAAIDKPHAAKCEEREAVTEARHAAFLRGQIAKAALAGMLADHIDRDTGMLWSAEDAAMHAVKYADALITELDK